MNCKGSFKRTTNDTFDVGMPDVCNGLCDLTSCTDEAECNGFTYGKFENRSYYYAPIAIGRQENYPALIFGQDGNMTDYTGLPSCHQTFSEVTVPIFNYTRCAAISYSFVVVDIAYWVREPVTPYCTNFMDQTNCTDPDRVALSCDIHGYLSTVSHAMICHGIKELHICDNGMENTCVTLSTSCTVHKHKVCDGTFDCSDQSDERSNICLSLTHNDSYSCKRVLGGHQGPIPIVWLHDGVVDCASGIDETGMSWPTCGVGDTFRFVAHNESCSEDFLCQYSDTKFIGMDLMCDKIDTCGNENEICSISMRIPKLVTRPISYGELDKHFMHCFKGLGCLEELRGFCVARNFSYPAEEIYGIQSKLNVVTPLKPMNCENMYGEVYMYMSCTDRCINAPCPLQRHLHYDSCPGNIQNRIYTLMNNEQLTFVTKRRDTFRNDYFLCKNDRKCISYDRVCNLVNDCGDGSDEEMCTNHFQCSSSGDYIAKSQVCDGQIDCHDLSDECNANCGKEIIDGILLKVSSWTIGSLAVLFNILILYKGFRSLKNVSSTVALLNKLLILLIGFGDFLIGAYLLVMSIIDQYFGKNYCISQVKWMTSNQCTILGVFSTIGSQISLFSMTNLSILRFLGIRNTMLLQGGGSKIKMLTINISVVLSVILVSAIIAMVPLFPRFEDFFVNGLTYESNNPLFIGITSKDTHFHISLAYYGRAKHDVLSWAITRKLIGGMFSKNYGGNRGNNVNFYGNDGVCLFKYFVLDNDPQKFYVWIILMINFICFLVISCSYLYINFASIKSSRQLNTSGKLKENKLVAKRNQKLQRKVSIIILTDFLCWVPFILVCGLHTLGVINASPTYALFSIVILPINSVINPLLFDTTVSGYMDRTAKTVLSRFRESSIYFSRSASAAENIAMQTKNRVEERLPKE